MERAPELVDQLTSALRDKEGRVHELILKDDRGEELLTLHIWIARTGRIHVETL